MTEGAYGAIKGSNPDWSQTNWLDRGRVHGTQQAELASTGVNSWGASPAPDVRPMRRLCEPYNSQFYAEPVVHGAHSTYYTRRATSDADPQGFRRSLRPVPDPGCDRVDRPEGKRLLAEPHGPPPQISSRGLPPNDLKFKQADHAAEPSMPRLARPLGTSGLRQSDKELLYERAMGRKVRVELDTYNGSGRAGDLSSSFAPPRRPEEDATFFKSLKDTPTFIRFCASLPPKSVTSPHERHTAELHRNHAAELQRERELVASLALPDTGGD